MGVLDFAKQLELESKAHYLKLAEQDQPQLRGIFNNLADQEQKHYDLFCEIELGKFDFNRENGKLIEKVKSVFNEISRDFSKFTAIADAEWAYSKAYEFEKKSIDYYQKLLPTAVPEEKKVLEFIIDQEKIHARLMDSFVLLVQSPKIWLENAEWNRLDAY